jgi:predicted phosphodiesterase
MRIAIVSDIHGNRTAFEAVLADFRETAPDLILHGGDLAASGANPAEIVDRVRDLEWQGVVGNTGEMLWMPESLKAIVARSPGVRPLLAAIEEIAAATSEALGEERVTWLRGLPLAQSHGSMTLVHASPESLWTAPGADATDGELQSVYGPLDQAVAIYGHIHSPYIRNLPGMVVANTGSVSLSYDGDRRASYLLLDDLKPAIRRVEYDVDREVRALLGCGLPHADWIAKILASGSFQML